MNNKRRTLGPNKEHVVTVAMLDSATYLGIHDERLADVLGVTPSSVTDCNSHSLILTRNTIAWRQALRLIEVRSALVAIIGDNQELIRLWLRSPNKSFQNRAPFELLVDPAESPALLEYLMAHRHQT